MKGSLIIVLFFILGCLCGYFNIVPFKVEDSNLSFYALLALLFSVGVNIGNDPNTLRNFRMLNPKLMLLPIATILGTISACALISIILYKRSLTDCLALGTGFGYYSLSSILVTESKGAELGIVTLLANIIREIITLIGAPLMVKYFGNLAPISSGGATTMDTTLPIITQTAGKEFAVLSIYHGVVVDFSVPFLVTLFCSI